MARKDAGNSRIGDYGRVQIMEQINGRTLLYPSPARVVLRSAEG